MVPMMPNWNKKDRKPFTFSNLLKQNEQLRIAATPAK
ncbi:MAG: hypothetical protein K0R47_3022 [Brevibacillus sp.]|jgi:hypothetical protein|nr:hypothetical protein [Brevibacillus sp.]